MLIMNERSDLNDPLIRFPLPGSAETNNYPMIRLNFIQENYVDRWMRIDALCR